MITIFTVPKPYNKKINRIQDNAIKNWLNISDEFEIITLGDKENKLKNYDFKHIDNIKKNIYGSFLINDIFYKIQKEASNNIIMYLSTDILLMKNIIEIIKKINNIFSEYLIIGNRWNIDINEKIDYKTDWEEHLIHILEEKGELLSFEEDETNFPYYSDLFAFPKGTYDEIKPLSIRYWWDNWIIHLALLKNIPVIDITDKTLIIHQNHEKMHKGYLCDEAIETKKMVRVEKIYPFKEEIYKNFRIISYNMPSSKEWQIL